MRDRLHRLTEGQDLHQDTVCYQQIKECYDQKQKTHVELYKHFMEQEKARNQQLIKLVASQQTEIAGLRQKRSRVDAGLLVNREAVDSKIFMRCPHLRRSV